MQVDPEFDSCFSRGAGLWEGGLPKPRIAIGLVGFSPMSASFQNSSAGAVP